MSNLNHTILITGGTTGLGFHTASLLARQFKNAAVVISARKDVEASAQAINRATGQDNVHFLPLDLGNTENVRAFVKAFSEKRLPPISHLLLNAGIQFPGDVQFTGDGIECTFGVNHVGHVLLFHLLQPFLATECRIVITSSGTHDPAQNSGLPDAKYTSGEELAHPRGAALNNEGRQRYATSKLCNVLWTYALSRRLTELPTKKWTVVAFDPGLMPGTGLARGASTLVKFLWYHVLPSLTPLLRRFYHHNIHTPQQSAANLVFVATSDTERETTGVYFEVRKEIRSSVESYDRSKQEELWSWTLNHLAANEEELRRFELSP